MLVSLMQTDVDRTPASVLPIVFDAAGTRPRMSGMAIVLFAAQSANEDAPRPPDTANAESVFQRYSNRGWQSEFARSVAPEDADPIVRPF